MIFNNKLTLMIQNFRKNNDKNHNIFLIYIVMRTTILQKFTLRFHFYMEK